MKKILMIVKGIGINGISNIMYSIISNTNKDKFKIDIACGEQCDQDYYNKFINIGCKFWIIKNRDKNILKYIFELRKIIKKENYDIVHIHGNSSMIFPELIAAWLADCKVRIVHSHNTTCDHIKLHKYFFFFVKYLTTKRIACGDAAGKWMFKNLDYEIINNGVDLEKFSFNYEKRKEIRTKLNISDNEILLGNVGGLTYQKNQIFLIELMEYLITNISEKYKLVIVGIGKEEENLKKIVNEKKLDNNIIFYGVSRNVEDVMNAMDIFLLPSNFEGFPCVLVEVQAIGLPCIISNSVSRETSFGKNTLFEDIDKNNIKDWSDKILLLEKVNKKDNEILNRKNIILNKFDLQSSINKIEKIYGE